MIQAPFKAYSGNEPFAFISYAHKDAEIVYEIIRYLNENGCRIWYDEGIEVGEKWAQTIASKLRKSKVLIACISQNMLSSQNCEREIYYAVKHKIEIFPIFIFKLIDLPEGLDMQLEVREYVNRADYIGKEDFHRAVYQALNNCESRVFDYAHNTKPLIIGGRELSTFFLRRNTVIEGIHSFITKEHYKLLLLQDVSGSGKSTMLLKYVEECYKWDTHGELVYFSFEYEPYFTKFLYVLGEKYFQDDIKNLSVDDIASRLLTHWENHRCTVIFDAIEQLFSLQNEDGEPQITDSRFLVFINDLSALKQVKVILATKLNINQFSQYPYLKKIRLTDISMIDFLNYLTDSGVKFNEDDDWDYLKNILVRSSNNMAIIQMFSMFVKEFGSKSITYVRVNQLLDTSGEILFEDKLFQYYWSQFNINEQSFLKELALFRREISVRTLLQIIPNGINKLELMNKIRNYLFANTNHDNNLGDTLSIHDIFKSAISAKTTPTERKEAHILASSAYIFEDTTQELFYLEMNTERIYHLIKGEEIEKAVFLMLTVRNQLPKAFIDLVYYHSQFPVCIELISMVLDVISADDSNYITLNRKIAMSLDKNGGSIQSLEYFENYIQASWNEGRYYDYIKGMYYKSEPICRLGHYSEAEQLIEKAWIDAQKYELLDERAHTNLLGRRALYRMKKGDLIQAEKDIMDALSICNDKNYQFDDKYVICCWWRLVHAKILMYQERFSSAENLLEESLQIAIKKGYVDFEAECYMEKAVLAILTNGNTSDLLDKSIALSGDNLYLLIRLRLIKIYLELINHPQNKAILPSIQSSRILLEGTGYEELDTLSKIILFYSQVYQNSYEYDKQLLPNTTNNSTEERLTQQVIDVCQKLNEIGKTIYNNTKNIKELI